MQARYGQNNTNFVFVRLIIIFGVALMFASVQFFSGLLYFHIGASNLFLVS